MNYYQWKQEYTKKMAGQPAVMERDMHAAYEAGHLEGRLAALLTNADDRVRWYGMKGDLCLDVDTPMGEWLLKFTTHELDDMHLFAQQDGITVASLTPMEALLSLIQLNKK